MLLCVFVSWFRLIKGFSAGHEQLTVVGFYPHGLIVSNGRHFNVHKPSSLHQFSEAGGGAVMQEGHVFTPRPPVKNIPFLVPLRT